jgi:hypothetical protein
MLEMQVSKHKRTSHMASNKKKFSHKVSQLKIDMCDVSSTMNNCIYRCTSFEGTYFKVPFMLNDSLN